MDPKSIPLSFDPSIMSVDRTMPEEDYYLRDEFAKAAMHGICASGRSKFMTSGDVAQEAYDIAKTMMEARKY